MRQCPHCGHYNDESAASCLKCRTPLPALSRALPKRRWFGPEKAHEVRRKALGLFVIGLLMKVYWGGRGPWQVIDNPTLASLRTWLEPLLLYGGGVFYVVGWILNWV